MSGIRLIRLLPSLVLAAAAIVYVWIAYDYDLASRSLPWIAGVLAIGLALIDIVATGEGAPNKTSADSSAAGSAQVRGTEERADTQRSPLQVVIAFAWIGAFLPLVIVLGFYGGIPLYIFCYLRLYAGKGGLVSAATAFGVAGCLYLVFEVFMGYALFGGLLGGDTL